jgi:hypothetical protein
MDVLVNAVYTEITAIPQMCAYMSMMAGRILMEAVTKIP